jgi:hypothetical protein
MHGLATGHESRQQLYTMLTRGRSANHLYVPVVGDGDQHTILPRSRPISARLYVQATRFHMSKLVGSRLHPQARLVHQGHNRLPEVVG